MNKCYDCGCYDAEREGCTMSSIDKWYACPIESALPENQEELKKLAKWYDEKKKNQLND